ncbi:MAG: cytochrome C554 [candidate division Zixibacteria bacterium]|nr:cytochrome C554 [candidate division Zixibacteria bacterium]
MKKIVPIIAIAAIVLMSMASAETTPKYVGSGKCKMCHKTEKQGKQFLLWEESSHAKAYLTLASEEAKTVATKLGIENAQTSDQCLSCHVTAFSVADSLKEKTFSIEEGVGCEACHGPGSDYKKMSIMKNRDKAIGAGLWLPDENTCVKCHNKDSPTYKEFKYEERLAEIAHPRPPEAAK